MTLSSMTFDENYGELPKSTLRLIRKFNVTPAEYDLMTQHMCYTFAEIEECILSRSVDGIFRLPLYM